MQFSFSKNAFVSTFCFNQTEGRNSNARAWLEFFVELCSLHVFQLRASLLLSFILFMHISRKAYFNTSQIVINVVELFGPFKSCVRYAIR